MLQRFVFVAVAVLILCNWYVEPFRVVSGSMAETLLGPHLHVICEDCGYPFDCGTDSPPTRPRAVCPNCGYPDNDLASAVELAGDRVLIHRSAFPLGIPGLWEVSHGAQRWQVVAFRHPSQANRIGTKRVVGLPGESIQIREGDVYVDGRIQRKNLRQQRAIAVLVHDANYRSGRESAAAAHWSSRNGDSRWGSADGSFAHPSTADTGEIDWLHFGNEPITDRCGYNQTTVRREEEIHAVTDLMLSLRVVRTFGQGGLLLLRLGDGRDDFQLQIDPNRRRWEVLRNQRAVPGAVGALPPIDDGWLLEVSLFDQQFLLAINGRTLLARPYSRSAESASTGGSAEGLLSLGSQGLGVTLRDVRVYRDVYYTHPIGPSGRWGLDHPVELVEDEYFVLGDNSPISDDSRTWPGGPAVNAKLLVGKPLLVHFPAKWVKWWKWTFQVPDPAKIRYIR